MSDREHLDGLPREIRAATARGWRFLPVQARGKRPLVHKWQKVATSDLNQLAAWAHQFPGCNWGLATGPSSGVFVLDVDGEPGLAALVPYEHQGNPLPETLTVKTARGNHLYFNWPKDIEIRNSANKLAKGLDIRGENGFVVFPPSVHANSAHYEFVEASEQIADAPDWLLKLIQQPAKPVAMQKVTSYGPGQRTPLLFSMAGFLRSKGVPQDGIFAALQGLNATFNPPHEEKKLRGLLKGVEQYPSGQMQGSLIPDLLCLNDVHSQPVSWLWKGYLAYGMLAMLSGDPDCGKTFIALSIAADLSNGRVPYTGEACEPISTLYLSNENSAEFVVRPRFDALGGNARSLHMFNQCLSTEENSEFRLPFSLKQTDVLETAINQTGAKLIIIDPIQSFLGAEVDTHRSNQTRPIMDGLIRIAEQFNLCILVIRHLTKASGVRAIHRGLGSIDLTGAVRMEMMAGSAADEPGNRAMVQIKNNIGPRADALSYNIVGEEMAARLQWLGKSTLCAADFSAPESDSEGKSDIALAEDYLLEKLANGPRRMKELENESGFNRRTLQRAGRNIGLKRNRDGAHGPWLWSLKTAIDDNQAA